MNQREKTEEYFHDTLRVVSAASLLVLLLLLAGCATIFSRSSYTVLVTSDPPGACVTVRERDGSVIKQLTTPATVRLHSSEALFQPALYFFDFYKQSYVPTRANMKAQVDGWYYFNIGINPLSYIGLLIDPITGTMYRLNDSIHGCMLPVESIGQPSGTGGVSGVNRVNHLNVINNPTQSTPLNRSTNAGR